MRILQVCHKPPFPPVDGGSIAMYNLFRGLTDSGHVVDVLAMNTFKQYCEIAKVPKDFLKKSNYTLVEVDIRVKAIPAFVNLFSAQSYNIIRFDNADFREQLKVFLKNDEYDIIILESLFSTSYINLIREMSGAKIVLRSHNVEYKIWENLSNNENNIFKRWYLKLLSRRLKKYELATLSQVDLIASISTEDIEVFKSEGCSVSMFHLPFGINFNDDEFRDYAVPKQEEMVLFHLGSMNWIPHQEAFRWFFDRVWMKLVELHPSIKLCLAGSFMPEWILNKSYPNVEVMNGYINGQEFMYHKAIMVVPSFSGSGIRIKIAEGMAKGKVIITTANGALGIPCTNHENIFISDNEEEWIDVISKCFTDINLSQTISINARQFAEKEFDYKSAAQKLMNYILNV